MSLSDDIKKFLKGRVIENEPMSRHTTLGVGGPAEIYVEALDENDLSAIVKYAWDTSTQWTIIGDGANLLVSDTGIRGLVIKLEGTFNDIDVDGRKITAGSATRISDAADVAAEHGLTGLEGVGTVPGSVGGAVVMNAGTHRGYIDEVIRSVSVVTWEGEIKRLSREDCGFTYRGSRFQHDKSLVITRVEMLLAEGDGEAVAAHLESVRKHRNETQPRGKSAGCFFKNPPGMSAGGLIETAGGKGMREGGAVVSNIHANFVMNDGVASATDLYVLAERVRELVMQKHGIELEYEVRLVGEW